MPAGEEVAASIPKQFPERLLDTNHGDNDVVGSEPETGEEEEVWTDLVKKVEALFASQKDFATLSDALARDSLTSSRGARSAWRSAMPADGAEGALLDGTAEDVLSGAVPCQELHPREGADSRGVRGGIKMRDGPAMRQPPQARKPSSSPPPPPHLQVPGWTQERMQSRPGSQSPLLPSAPSTPPCPREVTGSMRPTYTPPLRADVVGGISGNSPTAGTASPSPSRPGPLFSDGQILPTPAGAGTANTPSSEKGQKTAASPSCKKQSFRVARLGVPSPSSGSTTTWQPPERAPEPKDQGTGVSYIHIPRHSLKDFQSFARNVAAEARRETATDNPYVQALRKHRAELQTYSVIPSPMEEPSLEQQMGTEREALSLITPVMRPVDLSMMPASWDHDVTARGASARMGWSGNEDQAVEGSSCISWRCCVTDRAPWMLQVDPQLRNMEAERQISYQAACAGYSPRRNASSSPRRHSAVKPHLWSPLHEAASPPRSARSPLSARRGQPYIAEREESSLDDYSTGL